jgi:hypothetical protein
MLDSSTMPPLAAVSSPSIAPTTASGALARILDALEIEIVPTYARRGPRQTCAGQTLPRLLAEFGEAHLTLLLRTIVESEGNELALIGPVIHAVNNVMLARPGWPEKGLAWIEAFDGLDLAMLQKRARPIGKLKGCACSTAPAGIIVDRLATKLDPAPAPKLPKPSSPGLVAVELGMKLLAIVGDGKVAHFAREAAAMGILSDDRARTLVSAARLYGHRPQAVAKLSEDALHCLCAPSTPPARCARGETRRRRAGDHANDRGVEAGGAARRGRWMPAQTAIKGRWCAGSVGAVPVFAQAAKRQSRNGKGHDSGQSDAYSNSQHFGFPSSSQLSRSKTA